MAYALETGLVGATRGSFLNLFMKSVHGWADKTQQEASRSLGIDLEQVNKDLEEAAAEEALKYQEMLKNGETGSYDT